MHLRVCVCMYCMYCIHVCICVYVYVCMYVLCVHVYTNSDTLHIELAQLEWVWFHNINTSHVNNSTRTLRVDVCVCMYVCMYE